MQLDYAKHFTHCFGLDEEWHSSSLPHRKKKGLIQFITFRLADSLPRGVRTQIEDNIIHLSEEEAKVEKRKLNEKSLDQGLGSCALNHHEMAKVMMDALQHHDKKKYQLLAWSIMPNHIHVLIKIEDDLSKIMQSWKSFTDRWAIANNIKYNLGISKEAVRFWQPEYYDRFIRDEKHFNNTVKYSLENPGKAGLGKKSVAANYTGCSIDKT